MSTCSLRVNRETAEKIAAGWDLDNVWPWNPYVGSAHQYEWCGVGDGWISCWRCAVQQVLDGKREEVDLCTYEFPEIEYCECGTALGGWDITCTFCGRDEWVTEGSMRLIGDHLYSPGYPQCSDEPEHTWVCHTCINDTIDLLTHEETPDSLLAGDQYGWTYTRKVLL